MTTLLRIGKIAAAAGIAATALLGVSGSATAATADTAATPSTGVVLRPTIDQSRVLTVSSNTIPGIPTFQALSLPPASGSPSAAQRWNLVPAGPGLVTIENTVFGRLCVTADPNPGVTVIAPARCNGSTAQRWDIQPTAGGQRIRNFATGQVMAPNVIAGTPIGNVQEQAPALSTPGRIKQSWKIGS